MAVYVELLEFLTSSPSLEEIIDYQHAPATLARVRFLAQARRLGTINLDEKAELDEFYRANEFLEKLQVRARRRLGIPG